MFANSNNGDNKGTTLTSLPQQSQQLRQTNNTTSSSQNTNNSSVLTLQVNENDHFSVRDVDVNQPLQLASKYVDASLLRDRITPILDDSCFHGTATNYNYSQEFDGLGAYTPFERTEVISIPEEILAEHNDVATVSKMGLFPEISRAWVTIDNKLILWDLTSQSDFQTFDDIKQTILKVHLVKPKPNTFTDSINFLLVISTISDIHILAVSYSKNELDLYNTDMSVPTNGLSVDQFLSYDKTGRIFFTGATDGLNIWELQYSNTEDWFNKKCNKRCLTRSTVSNLIPGATYINSVMGYLGGDETHSESIKQFVIDQSRGILYTLSNTSVIRSYRIIDGGSLGEPTILNTGHITTYTRTSSAKASPLLKNKYLSIVSLNVVTRFENEDLFLVAITVGGLRLYLNGSYDRNILRLESVKFPPTKVTEEEIANEQRLFKEKEALKTQSSLLRNSFTTNISNQSLQASTELPSMLTYQKRSSVLVETKPSSVVLTPGIFFSVVSKSESGNDKLFVSVPDYGILKYHNKYVENSVFLESFGTIHQIVPLSKPFNATDRPQGYANEFATQYTNSTFEVAVLTNTSVQIYRYRTPSLMFESLTDDFTTFVSKYGLLEAASTALYVSCKYNVSKSIRANAFNFFSVGIPNVLEWKPIYKPSSSLLGLGSKPSLISGSVDATYSFNNVVLSPRFYGIVTVIGRLFRVVWNEKVFNINKDIKLNKDGSLDKTSIFENEFLESVNIDQNDVEFFLSSISVLNEFFQTYGNSIACFISPSFNNKNYDKAEEFSNQSENIAVNSVIRLIISIKEALSFIAVLIKEATEQESSTTVDSGKDKDLSSLKEIFKYLPLEVQQSLARLTFKDIFAPTDATKNLIKEILSSIINRSMSRGESIEYIAKGLQDRCGSFCSANDVVGFRAIEHLRKAKEIGFKDYDGLSYHLDRAVSLFEAINNEISLEKLKESVEILVSLNEYPRALKFVLNISSSIDQGNFAAAFVQDGKLANDDRKKFYEKRHELFEIVFDLLKKVDKLAKDNIANDSVRSSVVAMDYQKLKQDTYDAALQLQDKLFHYELYDWFIAQDISEILLELETPFILSYLEEKSGDSVIISDLLWIYQSKKGEYYSAALISYSLALSDFNISLTQRNEYLSRAIGFCNCTTLPHQRQQVIQLATLIEEVFEASNIQYDLLVAITNDDSLEENKKEDLISQLNNTILTVSELFNDYANVLSYHEICLNIYKVSDFKNSDEIISRWLQLFEDLKIQTSTSSNPEIFVKLLKQTVTRIGKKLKSSEFVFPVHELLPLVLNLIQESSTSTRSLSEGEICQIFISCDISYDKLYYVLKDLIKTTNNGEVLDIYKSNMVYLIKAWYYDDISLREVIAYEDIKSLMTYSEEKDPISGYMRKTGNSI